MKLHLHTESTFNFSLLGLGAAMFANTFISVIINNTRMVWLAFYACESFREKFPWTSCDREWTTTDCKDFDILEDDLHLNEKSRSPAYEFFRYIWFIIK